MPFSARAGFFRFEQSVAPVLGDFGLYRVLDNPNPFGTSASDQFGVAAAISENYIVVSAFLEDEESGNNSGKAYIYSTSTGALLHTLSNPNAFGTVEEDRFGTSVGISDLYTIVGSSLEDDASGNSSGKAYIFSTPTGNLLYTLDNPNPFGTSETDLFGENVDICDSYAIVGAASEDESAGNNSGKAYIYSTETGNLVYTVNNPNAFGPVTDDRFGSAVAICDNYFIVGASAEDDASGNTSGKAYIFSTETGNLVYTLDNPNPFGTSAVDSFAISVDICDNYAIVGASLEDQTEGTNSGKAYIFSTETGNLLYTLDNPNAFDTVANDRFGRTVAISNSFAIVGANLEDDINGTSSGKAYIFSTETGNLLYTLDNPNAFGTSANDNFSVAVGITDTHAIVAANEEGDSGGTISGKAYLYNRIEDEHITPVNPSVVYITNAVGIGNVVIPSTARVGDIAVLFDTSTSTGDVIPSGWTSINGITTGSAIRTNISYKILVSGDVNSTVSGIGGNARKVLTIFRTFNDVTPPISLSTVSAQATTSTPTEQTITGNSGAKSCIYFAAYSKTDSATPTRGFTQTGQSPTEIISVGSQNGIYVKFTVVPGGGVNSVAHSNASITMTVAGTVILQSFRMEVN